MSDTTTGIAVRPGWPRSLPIYYGWVNVLIASATMTATLPGRTHGLGLITEALLADLALDRVVFARVNLLSSIVGALFALPAGWLIDRIGVRRTLVAVVASLGIAVLAMSRAGGLLTLLTTLVLVRGLGQSALSVVSMAAIGKWFRRRLGIAMGVFAVLLTFGFIASVLALGAAVEAWGWRAAWQKLGYALISLVPLCWLLARDTPESCGLTPDALLDDRPANSVGAQSAMTSFSLRRAMATPAFWVVVLGGSCFNLVWSAVTLFNESMLVERGLPPASSVEIMAILTGTGLLANLACGALALRVHIVKLLGLGMGLLAAALCMFPAIESSRGAQLYASLIGFSGGVVTVVFFAAWGHLFGRRQLGRIQGAAQFATVLASAIGPLLLAESRAWTGSYSPMLYVLAACTAILAVAAVLVPLPGISHTTRRA